ncbi:cinnamoyl-CoA reductase 2 isoform X1 [Brachypodium distachyon]|uniref:cinnamoyl-CoA reductase 2 isoform X1 n=1 Tax=Brachypodium distachyon TaxID=15368 RepID=UPI0001D43295|nr:cinnamoyl-CoA reductase 2 isoform X1 [Brachypodium distachyon]|eukprot:XP_014755202.1 cinnamoyl-CoA reductase 2 isoform X1 [Brachypodium distachyon]
MESSRKPRLCVTGGGGYIASWLVKLLLSRGYAVHATVRDPRDPKNACLKQLDKAQENLHLFMADVLDYDALTAAFARCEGVFHVASPVPIDKMVDKEKEMMAPTVKGTMNVLKACSAMNVQKLIVVSSGAAVTLNTNWPQDKLKDESCWSDKDFCKENEIWYALAKTEAEEMALEYGQENGLHVVTFCPGAVFGPLLQHVVLNITTKYLRYIIKGGPDIINNKFWPIVDVRDVTDALLLLYDKAGSSERYICSSHQMDIKDLVNLMKSMYPNYSYADKLVDVDYKLAMTCDKLKNLGWEPRKLEETLADSIVSYENAGILGDVDGEPCRVPYFYRMPPVLE